MYRFSLIKFGTCRYEQVDFWVDQNYSQSGVCETTENKARYIARVVPHTNVALLNFGNVICLYAKSPHKLS